MPKRNFKDLSVGQRHSLIKEALEKKSSLSCAEIMKYVVEHSDVKSIEDDGKKSSFLKTIRRDLNTLASSSVRLRYYNKGNPEEEIESDDPQENASRKYIVKYSLIESEESIKGQRVIAKTGALFIPSAAEIEWCAADLSDGAKTDSIHLSIEFGGKYFSISCPEIDCPAQIIIGRRDESSSKLFTTNALTSAFSKRTSLLYWQDTSISRITSTRPGHVIIKFQKDLSTISISDLGSTHGTFYAKAEKNSFDLILSMAAQRGTVLNKKAIISRLTWNTVAKSTNDAKPADVTMPVYIKLGGDCLLLIDRYSKS